MTTTVDANNTAGFKVTADTSGILALQTNSTTALTVTASQTVGIGTSSPGGKVEITAGTGTGLYINQSGSTGNGTALYIRQPATSVYAPFEIDTSAGTSVFQIESDGRITLNGGGIVFPANQIASANVNTLDDYEEGTWTPNINSSNGTGTFTSKVGSYVKIGKQVTIWFVVDSGNSLAAGTTQYLAGLPFNIGSLQTTTVLGQMGSNGPALRTHQLMTLSGNRAVMYIYDGGTQETTTISFGAGCATYWID